MTSQAKLPSPRVALRTLAATAAVVTACTDAPTATVHAPSTGPSALIVCGDPGSSPDCSGGSGSPSPAPTYAYGVNANNVVSGDPTFDAGLASMVSLLAQAKINWVRLDVNWLDYQDTGVQCVNGVAPAPNRNWSDHGQYASLDREIQRATNAGLNVLPVLAYPPVTESSGGCNPPVDGFYHYAPRDLDGWKAFVSAMVARYPQVKLWEIWNETNAGFFRVLPGSNRAQAYAALVNAAAPIIHAAGGQVLGVDAINNTGNAKAVASGAVGSDTGFVETQSFVRDVMRLAGNNVDVASLHFYPVNGQAVVTTINTTVNTIKSVAPSSPATNAVWVTEANLDTNSPDLNTQATTLTGVLNAMVGRGAPAWRGTIWWHAFLDGTHGTTDNRGIMSGVFTNSIQLRPAYTAYKNFTATH